MKLSVAFVLLGAVFLSSATKLPSRPNMRYVYQGPPQMRKSVDEFVNSLPKLVPPQGGMMSRVYRVRGMMPMMVPKQPEPVPEGEEPEPLPPGVEEEEKEVSPYASFQAYMKKIMQKATNKLSTDIESEDPVCPWTMLGTESATAVVEAAMEARGGYYGLKAFNRRMENIRMMCEMTAEGVQKCDEQHKITVDFTVSETDQCPYQAKCDCKMLNDAEPIRCSACAKVDGDLEVTELKVKCSDDGKEEEEEEVEEVEEEEGSVE